MAEKRPAMPRQPLQINHLHAQGRQHVQHLGLGRPGIAIQHHHRACHRRLVQRLHHKRAPRLVSARNRIHPPANLGQDRGKRPRPLPPAPAIDQGLPRPRLLGQRPLQMHRRVLGHQRRPHLARRERADLLVDRANLGPFRIIQNRQRNGPGDMIVRIFCRCADIDDVVKPKGKDIGQVGQGDRHARPYQHRPAMTTCRMGSSSLRPRRGEGLPILVPPPYRD